MESKQAGIEQGTPPREKKPHPCGLGLPPYFTGEEVLRGLKGSPEPLSIKRAVRNVIAFFFHKEVGL